VPGAWHRPKHYERLNMGLEKFNYESVGVTLPSVDSKPPVTSWDKDAEAIRVEIMRNLDSGKDVIVIAHSYGGVPMSEAVKGLGKQTREQQGLSTGVLRLIYMCAVALQKGESLVTQTAPVTPEEVERAQQQMKAMHMEEDGTITPADKEIGREALYNRCDPKDADWAIELCGTHPAAPFAVPATYTAYLEIPSTYIVTENDHALPSSIQERMIALGNGAFDVERCEEGHSPFLSNPGFIVDCIRRAAGEDV